MKQGNLRIISGKWRRRQIRFNRNCRIRPTTDAARETLFNWLAGDVIKARCLDLFAGSGALGIEALSRDAEFVVFVDKSRETLRCIKDNCQTLQTNQFKVVTGDALAYLKNSQDRFDIVFVDPPFNMSLVSKVIELLSFGERLNCGAKIYTETEKSADEIFLPKGWTILREYRTSNRLHRLYQFNEANFGENASNVHC